MKKNNYTPGMVIETKEGLYIKKEGGTSKDLSPQNLFSPMEALAWQASHDIYVRVLQAKNNNGKVSIVK